MFDEACMEDLNFLKEKFVTAPIIVSPSWS